VRHAYSGSPRFWASGVVTPHRDEWYAAAGRESASEYLLPPDGRTVRSRGPGVALRDEAGAVTGHLGTVDDTTSGCQGSTGTTPLAAPGPSRGAGG
jgi:hypothetical protein